VTKKCRGGAGERGKKVKNTGAILHEGENWHMGARIEPGGIHRIQTRGTLLKKKEEANQRKCSWLIMDLTIEGGCEKKGGRSRVAWEALKREVGQQGVVIFLHKGRWSAADLAQVRVKGNIFSQLGESSEMTGG